MKTFRIILIVVCLLVSVFFIVFAQIQTEFAKEQQARADTLAQEAVLLQQKAEEAAMEARASEMHARDRVVKLERLLDECQSSK